MLLFRRLPGLLFNHVYFITVGLVFLFIIIFFLLSWGFVCSNIEPWRHINRLCFSYATNQAFGDLCHSLCVDRTIHTFSCQPFHAGKDTVFTASLSDDKVVVVKSAQKSDSQDTIHWNDQEGDHYPTEKEFVQMIQRRVHSRLNITMTDEEAERLAKFPSGYSALANSNLRNSEMKELWELLQDNEYMLSMVFAELETFPKLIGSCGQYFVTEYLEPVLEGEIAKLMTSEGSSKSWTSRIHIASLILNLIQEVDSAGLLMCDIKGSHFGVSPSGKIKALDLDVTLPKAVADKITANGRPCQDDDDCSLFDCRSECSKEKHICDKPVTTTNAQVVCKKILVGDKTGSIVLPGLLMGPRTSGSLAALLRHCSNGTPIVKRLQDTLHHLHKSLSSTNDL